MTEEERAVTEKLIKALSRRELYNASIQESHQSIN